MIYQIELIAGWTEMSFLDSLLLLVVLGGPFVLFWALPGLIVLFMAHKAKRKYSQNPGSQEAAYIYAAQRKKYKTYLIVGISLLLLPYIYWGVDGSIKSVWEVVSYPGTYYSLNDETRAKYEVNGIAFNTESSDTVGEYGESISERFEECSRIISPKFSCFPYEHEEYGTIYIDDMSNIGPGINDREEVLIQTNDTTIQIITKGLNWNWLADNSGKDRNDVFWERVQPIIEGIERIPKWKLIIPALGEEEIQPIEHAI